MFSGLITLILLGELLAIAVKGPCIPVPRLRFSPDASTPTTQERMLANAAR
jgi:hypothetical protein